MAPTFRASTAAPATVEADLLVVAVFEDREPGPGADAADAALDGGLDAFLREADFTGKANQALPVPSGGRIAAGAVLVVGLGARDRLDVDGVRRAGATVARRARTVRTIATTVVAAAAAAGLDRAEAARAFAEGVLLGGYQFLAYKGEAEPSKLAEVVVLGSTARAVNVALERAQAVSRAVTWARDIVNTPAGEKSPAAFAQASEKLLGGSGVKVEVLDLAQIRKAKLGGVLGVGQGSTQTPRFVKVTYAPRGARGTLALVGKGVVFDSGGLSLKTSTGMETMKTDMSGAAAVLATMSVLRELGVKAKVVAYAPMVENMPSGTAIRPGDVLRTRNGKTVEVLNTDAEGRLILADALALAAEDGADAIVDVATLTGACVVALGDKVAGLMGNDDAWRDQVAGAAERAGEAVWPLPLPEDYQKLLESEIADLRNISTGSYGGALTAGLFLQAFVDGHPWAHLDIAGPARANADDGELVKGGTGFAVRTLVELASTFRPPRPPRAAGAARAAATTRSRRRSRT